MGKVALGRNACNGLCGLRRTDSNGIARLPDRTNQVRRSLCTLRQAEAVLRRTRGDAGSDEPDHPAHQQVRVCQLRADASP